MGEKDDGSGDLLDINLQVDPITGGVSGGMRISNKVATLFERILPVGWMGKRKAERAVYEHFYNKIRALQSGGGEGFTDAEIAVATGMLSDNVVKFMRLYKVLERAKEITEQRIAAGETPRLLPADASSPSTTGETSSDFENRIREDASLVDDETVGEMYARILAEEYLHPGAITKRTLGVLRDLDRPTAENFLKLVAMLIDGHVIPSDGKFINTSELIGLNLEGIIDLDDAGLVDSAPTRRKTWKGSGVAFLRLSGQNKAVVLAKEGDFEVEMGVYVLTPAGRQLARVLPVEPSVTVLPALLDHLKSKVGDGVVQFADLPSPTWIGPLNALTWATWRPDPGPLS